MRVDPMPGEITKPGEECGVPREVAYPAPEYTTLPPEYPAMPPEEATIPPEYTPGGRRVRLRQGNTPRNGRFAEDAARRAEEAESEEKRKRRVRKQLLRTFAAPVAAVIAAVAVVFASFGYDPLSGSPGTGLSGEAVPGGGGTDTKIPAGGTPTPVVSDATPTPMMPVATPTGGPTPTPTPELLIGAEGNTFAVPVTWTMIHAEAPNGVVFDSSLTDGDPMDEVLAWLATWNGRLDKSSMTTKRVFLGYLLAEGTLPIGDLDDPASLYIFSGTMYSVYREDIYYKAEAGTGDSTPEQTPTPTPVVEDTSFPTLPNPDPDTEGAYAWNGNGDPEEYILIANADGSSSFLVSGSGIGGTIMDVPGAVYDAATNTLTLTNCNLYMMEVNLMGNSFTINLVGDNHVGQIKMWGAMYAGSLTLTGTGTLTLNEDRSFPIGLIMNAEASTSALLVDRGIKVDVYGDVAVIVGATSLDQGIYCRTGVEMTGGQCRRGEYSQYLTTYVTLADAYTSLGTFYDYAVVDDDGVPVSEVHFTDPDR